MYSPNTSATLDSDGDDYEGYFLRPAYEYNIQEKIEEANQELLLEIQSKATEILREVPMVTNGAGRKVTFRPNLEEFEPELLLLHSTSSLESIPERMEAKSEPRVNPSIDEILEQEEDVIFESLNFLTIDPISFKQESSHPNKILEADSSVIKTEDEVTEFTISSPRCLSNKEDLHSTTTITYGQTNRKITIEIMPKDTTSLPQLPNTLKYKYCCEQKKLNETLPRYDGEYSDYGLSKRQLQIKRAQSERRRKCGQEVEFRRYQDEMERSRANEEAFERWLRKKLASIPKKYVNRYEEQKKGKGK